MHQCRVPGQGAPWTAGDGPVDLRMENKNPRGWWFFVSNVDIKVLIESEELNRILYNNNVSFIYNLNDLASSKGLISDWWLPTSTTNGTSLYCNCFL